jgi:5-methylcytosine-specific restriction enzyme subunit McrC
LSRAEAAEVTRSELVDVAPLPDGSWLAVTNSRVGVAVGADWELRVSPKLDVSALMFLLAYATDPKGWRDDRVAFDIADDLFDAVAVGFSLHALNALKRGALHGYLHVDERLMSVRGRVRFGDQLARSMSLPLPIEVSYDDYTADILENRMLKTAAQILLRLGRVPTAARLRLLQVRALLDEVAFVERPGEIRSPPLTRLNQRYGPALRLAELILRASSVDTEHGSIVAASFVFDMNRVFEDFVTTAFREAMAEHGGEVRSQVKPYSLDEGEKLPLKPDISWWLDGRCFAVLDAKYKEIKSGVMRHDDAYQMLAYCTAYKLPRGYLVYAKDSGVESRVHEIRNSDVEIEVRALDVGVGPEALLDQLRALAKRVTDFRQDLKAAA